jgi:hypothetical protein
MLSNTMLRVAGRRKLRRLLRLLVWPSANVRNYQYA